MASKAPMQEETMRKGPWLEEEDERLTTFVTLMGERRWDSIARVSGLRRSGKSCRLRWLNYLHPDLKRSPITTAEEHIILQLQQRWGNKWSKIVRRLPGRTDNEIKNYWKTHLRKKTQAQEQEKLQREAESTMRTPDDTSILTNSSYSMHDDSVTKIPTEPSSVDAFGTSDYAFGASPYENRIWDWITEAVQDEDYNVCNTWLCNQASGGECWTGLWNMEQPSGQDSSLPVVFF